MVRNDLTTEALIDHYIDPNPWGGGGRHRQQPVDDRSLVLDMIEQRSDLLVEAAQPVYVLPIRFHARKHSARA